VLSVCWYRCCCWLHGVGEVNSIMAKKGDEAFPRKGATLHPAS
jgi:hypothetical protein